MVAELKQLHRHYQANTVRTRNVLSTFYLGCAVIASNTLTVTGDEIRRAIKELRTNRYAFDLTT
jgi:hypothetical protein